ncbi:Hypothetical protein NTJ_02480 [Nesidiocoris tenuis]|uniref:Uncharacterized protein n=1 Tax=Nesidiocoris tenuis TaxID=355587 RepID=A0ABN7ACA3_9HEMI|nr:Hypothetical protein NTJ_02480 [Nesidiocoris tenuis]
MNAPSRIKKRSCASERWGFGERQGNLKRFSTLFHSRPRLALFLVLIASPFSQVTTGNCEASAICSDSLGLDICIWLASIRITIPDPCVALIRH